MIRTLIALAAFAAFAGAQTFTVGGALPGGQSVSVTAHENQGSSVAAVVIVDGVSCALELAHRHTTPQGYRHYSGVCSDGTKVSLLLGHSEGPIGSASNGSGSGTLTPGAVQT